MKRFLPFLVLLLSASISWGQGPSSGADPMFRHWFYNGGSNSIMGITNKWGSRATTNIGMNVQAGTGMALRTVGGTNIMDCTVTSGGPGGGGNVYTSSNNTYVSGTTQTMDVVAIGGNLTLQQGQQTLQLYNTSADQIVIGNAGRGTNSVVIGYRALSANPLDIVGKGGIVAIGHEAGYNVTNATAAVFVGYDAGYNASNSANSVMIGNQAGASASGQSMTLIGALAGANADGSGSSIMMGFGAGEYASNSPYVNFSSFEAGYAAHDSVGASLHGNAAGYAANNSPYLYAEGYNAAHNASNASYSIMIGRQAGQYATNSSNCIFIGDQAGADIQRPYTMVIDNNPVYSRSNNALIYGEFDNRLIKVNGTFNVNGILNFNNIVNNTNSVVSWYIGTNQIWDFSSGAMWPKVPICQSYWGATDSPAYAFDGDWNSGMYLESPGVLGFAAGGSNTMQILSDGVNVLGSLTTTSWFYLHGDVNTDGSWRQGWNPATSNVVMQVRVSGSWTNSAVFTAP